MVPSTTKDYDKRTSLNAYRTFFSTLGIMIGSSAGLIVDAFVNKQTGLIVMGGIFGLTCIITSITSAISVKENTEYKYRKPFQWKNFLTIFECKPFIDLAKMFLISCIGLTMLSSSFIYFSQYILKSESFTGLIIFNLGILSGIPLWRYLDLKYEKKSLLLFSVITGSILILALSIFVTSNFQILFYVIMFVLGVLLSTLQIFPYSLLPDIVNYYELFNGKRIEAVFYGAWIVFYNISGAIGSLFTSFVIWFGSIFFSYNTSIRFAFGFFPSIILVIGVLQFINYPITKAKYKEIINRLDQRKSE